MSDDNGLTPFYTIYMSKIQLIYYTDPLCSSCWLSEPFLNRLLLEYGTNIHLDVRMGGLLPSWEVYKPSKSNMPKKKNTCRLCGMHLVRNTVCV